MKIVAIEREYGSGAANIGKTIADRLGWRFWDHEITNEIARRLHCKAESVQQREERMDSMFYRLMKAFMRGSFEAGVATPNLELLDAEQLSILFEKVITQIAEGGNCVIIGRAAPWFLRERKDTFRVFLYAPSEEKFRRTLAQGKSRDETENLLETVDRDRAAFIRKYYNKEWPDRYIYHMMLNVNCGDEIAVETILHCMRMQDARDAGVPAI
ncbi:MAG TPA: cytidylate kinase-like family protein, partial [Bryobacteraceae bacterium]|nr:cytidylate kinase-like family protein [Bryobacteraceae bacterium]